MMDDYIPECAPGEHEWIGASEYCSACGVNRGDEKV